MNKFTHALTAKQLEYVLDEFEDRKDFRMMLVCLLMAKTLRVSDVLNLRVGNLYDERRRPLEALYTREKKTGKPKRLPLKGERLEAVLKAYGPAVRGLPRRRAWVSTSIGWIDSATNGQAASRSRFESSYDQAVFVLNRSRNPLLRQKPCGCHRLEGPRPPWGHQASAELRCSDRRQAREYGKGILYLLS